MSERRVTGRGKINVTMMLRAHFMGASISEISGKMGVTKSAVIKRLRNLGLSRSYRHAPRLWDVFRGMDPAVVDWVIRQAAPGVTAADVMRGILVDAYNQEHGNE